MREDCGDGDRCDGRTDVKRMGDIGKEEERMGRLTRKKNERLRQGRGKNGRTVTRMMEE